MLAQSRALATGAIQPQSQGAGIDARRANMTDDEIAAADKKEQNEMIKFFTIMMIGVSLVMCLVAVGGFEIAVSAEDERYTRKISKVTDLQIFHQWYLTSDDPDPLSLWFKQMYHGASAWNVVTE